MSSAKKTVLLVLGGLSALGVVSQLVLGQLILGGRGDLVKMHQHSGYTTVALVLLYLALSLSTLASMPTTKQP
jgi:hypothetical protein